MADTWGPHVWTLFHTLAEKVNEDQFRVVSVKLFGFIKRICSLLPCPECQEHAKRYLSMIKPVIDTKQQLKQFLFTFHNHVNTHKRKLIQTDEILTTYSDAKLATVYNSFITSFTARGNNRLLADTLHRNRLLQEFRKWLLEHARYFY